MHEGVHHVVGVGTVPDQRLAAKQHLQGCVGYELLEGAETLPGVFAEESRRRVEGRAAPDLHGVEADGVHSLGDGHHVLGAESGRHQALMGVTERGVGDLDGSGGGHEVKGGGGPNGGVRSRLQNHVLCFHRLVGWRLVSLRVRHLVDFQRLKGRCSCLAPIRRASWSRYSWTAAVTADISLSERSVTGGCSHASWGAGFLACFRAFRGHAQSLAWYRRGRSRRR